MADKKNNFPENTGSTDKKSSGSEMGSQGASTQSGGDRSSLRAVDNKSTESRTFGTSSTGSGTGAATATARSFVDQAKETAGQAVGAVTEKAATTLDERKSTVATGLSSVADSLRKAGESISTNPDAAENPLADMANKYGSTAAQKLEDVAGYFDRKNVKDMVRDVEGFARRNPAIFIGAAFAAGMLAARFLKSSSPSGNFEQNPGRQLTSGTSDQSTGTSTSKLGTSGTAGFEKQSSPSVGTMNTPTTDPGTRDTSGASDKNTSSTRDSISNPM